MKNLIKDFLKNKSWIELAFRDIHISVEHPIDVVYSFGYKTRIGKLYKTGFHVYPGNSSDLESSLPFGNILKNLCRLYKTAQHSVQFAPRYWMQILPTHAANNAVEIARKWNTDQSRVGCQEPPEHCQNSRPPSTISQTGTGTASPIFSKIILINFLCLLWTSWWASNKTDGKRYALPPPQSGQCPFELLVYFPRGKFQKEENH